VKKVCHMGSDTIVDGTITVNGYDRLRISGRPDAKISDGTLVTIRNHKTTESASPASQLNIYTNTIQAIWREIEHCPGIGINDAGEVVKRQVTLDLVAEIIALRKELDVLKIRLTALENK
jgi:hypothetical protein